MNDEFDPCDDLAQELYRLLQAAPAGISEYQLIRQLKDCHCTHIPDLPLTDKLALFRTHFLVFNALYRLRDQLWAEQSGHVQISPLCVQLLPYRTGKTGIAEHDPLRDYYLDLSQLSSTGEEEVEKLLVSFWIRIRGGEERRAALELFGLLELVDVADDSHVLDFCTIKQRYRQLVSRHHPDRGGDTTRLQSINMAMAILERYYGQIR